MQTRLQIGRLHDELQRLRDQGVSRTLREHLDIARPGYVPSTAGENDDPLESQLARFAEEQGASVPDGFAAMERESEAPTVHTYSLEKYLEEMLTENAEHTGGVTDIRRITVRQFLDLGDDFIKLFSELILGVVTDGYRAVFDLAELLALSIDTSSTAITLPIIDTKPLSKMVGADESVETGVEFKKDFVTVGTKTVDVGDFGRQIDLPTSTVEDLPFDILSVILRQRGIALAIDKVTYLIDIFKNGDRGVNRKKKSVADSIATIGVTSTENGITFRDILRAAVRMALKGFPASNILAEEEQFIDIQCLEEFWKKEQGSPRVQLKVKGGIKIPDTIWPIITGIGDSSCIVHCPESCTGEFKRQGLKIETQKLITKRLHEVVVSTRLGYMNFFRAARVLIDGTQTITEAPFPDYMSLFAPEKKGV